MGNQAEQQLRDPVDGFYNSTFVFSQQVEKLEHHSLHHTIGNTLAIDN